MNTTTMSDKQAVLETIGQMPETASLDQIRNELALLEALREGHADILAGRTVPHEAIKQKYASWLTK